MPQESTITAITSRRNTTVIAAWVVIGMAALLEIILSAVAMAPRVAAAFRNSQPSTTLPAQGEQADAPASAPLEAMPVASPVQSVGKAPLIRDSDLPSRQPPADAAMPGGALLQIVSDRLESSGQGSKKLQVTIKGDKRQQIQVSEVKVQVYFYDEENGEIVPSKAQVTSSWLSLPVDWKKEIPELLEVNYLPDSVDENIRFAGYLVAIYYKGDLQDCRANPPRLKKLFEPKYFIGNDEP
jgi:hypothetical protein